MDASSTLSEIVWLVILLAFLAGLALGAFGYYLLSRAKGTGKLQSRIDILEKELNTYKSKVNDHFLTTAELVNRLTENYRDVHRHLVTSADELCTNEAVQDQFQDALLSAGSLLGKEPAASDDCLIDPPRDYALQDDQHNGKKTLS